MRGASRRRLGITLGLMGMSGAVGACGLALGIDDVPPVPGHDAAVLDATHPVDAHDARVVIDARADHPVDAKPDRGIDAADVLVGQLPPRSGAQTTSDAGINFAAHYLWLGETDKTTLFHDDPSAWQTFGYNIDGKVTTAASTDVCTLASNASATVQMDGNDGADNSFGENLVEDFSVAFGGDFSKSLSSKVSAGNYTALINTSGLTPSPTQTNVGLTTELLGGARFPGTPTFTLADNWPVDPTTLADGISLANGAKISFSDSYVTGGMWVSGEPADIVFTIQISDQPLTLVFHHAVATFSHTIDDAGASHAKNGSIAGILRASEVYSSIASIIGAINGGEYCDLLGVFQSKITSAQDIMEDGTNTPGVPCNGISIAIAFEADEIQLPSVVAARTVRDAAAPTCPSDAGDAGH